MRFRLLTYNIHKGIGVDRRFRPERIIDILEYYNADVVLLQEVDHNVPRSGHTFLATEIARALRYDFRAFGINVYLRRGKYGNATLSRFPITRQRNIDLSLRWRKRRGAQHTSIQVSMNSHTAEIDIFNVHLGLSATERRTQVRRLLESAEMTRLPSEQPCIVAGDMNDWRNVLKRRRFSTAGFSCATNRYPGSRRAIKTFPSYAPSGGLDKIFYRGSLKLLHAYRSRLEIAKIASDHLPVIADFEL